MAGVGRTAAAAQMEGELRACPPLWAPREAWPGLTPAQRDAAAVRAARSGAAPSLQFMFGEVGYDERSGCAQLLRGAILQR
jgi:hypothetical protein